MKKFAVLLVVVGIFTLAASMALGQSEWAYYKENPLKVCTDCGGTVTCYVAEGYKGPRIYILDSTYTNEGCTVENYTLDCCACHGPNAPGNHGGPQFPEIQCP